MNQIFALVLVVLICSCSATVNKNDATIGFDHIEFNFGKLEYRNEADHIFVFKNTGSSPLIIYDVKTSCGCTVADWAKKPLKPGTSGEIRIKYNSEFPGMFSKEVTVHFNGKESPAVLRIKGQVEYPQNIDSED